MSSLGTFDSHRGIAAHRIGQTRHVFAYRLIARDTVEERVLELQVALTALRSAVSEFH